MRGIAVLLTMLCFGLALAGRVLQLPISPTADKAAMEQHATAEKQLNLITFAGGGIGIFFLAGTVYVFKRKGRV